MLGIVFTEFCEMVENEFSPDTLDELLQNTEGNLESRAIYTAVGNYSHEEMLVLVTRLSEMTQTPVSELIRSYGHNLFGKFVERYPFFFTDIRDSLSFLESVERHIHREVRKLYPSAELPSFNCQRRDDDSLTMIYRSTRPFAMLALGLIEGCAAHFGEDLEIGFDDLSDGAMTHAHFEIVRRAAS